MSFFRRIAFFGLITIGSISCITGSIDIGKASLNEIYNVNTAIDREDQTRNTTEGLTQISIGGILLLLSRFLDGKKEFRFYSTTRVIEWKLGFLNNKDETNIPLKKVIDKLNSHKSDFIYIIEKELGVDYSLAISVNKISFFSRSDKLFLKLDLEILKFTSDKNQEKFICAFLDFLLDLLDKKSDHIEDEMAKKIADKGNSPDKYVYGDNLIEVISVCIKDEVLGLEDGKKHFGDISSFFKKTKYPYR